MASTENWPIYCSKMLLFPLIVEAWYFFLVPFKGLWFSFQQARKITKYTYLIAHWDIFSESYAIYVYQDSVKT